MEESSVSEPKRKVWKRKPPKRRSQKKALYHKKGAYKKRASNKNSSNSPVLCEENSTNNEDGTMDVVTPSMPIDCDTTIVPTKSDFEVGSKVSLDSSSSDSEEYEATKHSPSTDRVIAAMLLSLQQCTDPSLPGTSQSQQKIIPEVMLESKQLSLNESQSIEHPPCMSSPQIQSVSEETKFDLQCSTVALIGRQLFTEEHELTTHHANDPVHGTHLHSVTPPLSGILDSIAEPNTQTKHPEESIIIPCTANESVYEPEIRNLLDDAFSGEGEQILGPFSKVIDSIAVAQGHENLDLPSIGDSPSYSDPLENSGTEGFEVRRNKTVDEVRAEVLSTVAARVPKPWTVDVSSVCDGRGVRAGLFATCDQWLIQRSLFVGWDGNIQVGVHGKDLVSSHPFWKNVSIIPLCPSNIEDFISNFVAMVSQLRSLEICCGVEKFSNVWKLAEQSEIDLNPFKESRYKTTCRSTSCLLLVPNLTVSRCGECSKLWKVLYRHNAVLLKRPESTPPKSKADAYCNTPEMKRRLARQRRDLRNALHENEKLRFKIDEILGKEGVQLGEDESDELLNIVQSEEGQETLSDISKLFIQEIVKASKKKDARAIRWPPAIIRVALKIRMASAAAYEELRGVIRLPSERTLFDYSHFMTAKDGIHDEVILDVAKELKSKYTKRFQQFHVLAYDEIFVKQNLVFKSSTGEMVGYVRLNEVDEEIRALNNLLDEEVMHRKEHSEEPPPLANKMQCYMVKGVANGIKSVVACFPTRNTSKETLEYMTWDVVGALEVNNILVIALVCDGGGPNMGFYQSQPSFTTNLSGVVFCTFNRFDPSRPLFLLNDPCHLVKTTRNCVYASGKPGKKGRGVIRLLTKNGKQILWNLVVKVYEMEKNNTIKRLFKINEGDVYLTPFSAMNVKSAARILSRSFANVLDGLKSSEASEFASLCRVINDTFDMLNGAYGFQDVETRNDLLGAYQSSTDFRFDLLMKKLQYFEDWKNEVSKMTGLSQTERAKRILSRQTLDGWERTIKGFSGAAKFVLRIAEEDKDPVRINAQDFSQDDLEHYYSKVRSTLGGNRHPDVNQLMQTHRSLHVQRKLSFIGKKKSNLGSSKMNVSLEDLSRPVPKRPRPQRKIT